MSDFESFGGFEAGESFDPASFERFKERMAAAAAQIAAIKREEKKARKTEDELIKILVAFLKSGKKGDIMQLVSRLLEQNVPAGLIVAILAIFSAEIQQKIGVNLLPSPDEQKALEHNGSSFTLTIGGDETLPLKLRIAIISWADLIRQKANEKPMKVVQTTVSPEGELSNTLVQLTTFCLREFFQMHRQEQEFNQLRQFSQYLLQDIIGKIKKDIDSQKKLQKGE